MTTADNEQAACTLLKVARLAAQHALTGYRRPKRVEWKGDVDLVTDFDRSAEDIIRRQLAEQLPYASVVAEEAGGTAIGEFAIYADPIDGTTNYVHGHPFWCTSIGLTQHGQPIAGAVVAPALHVEWMGWVGGQAFRNADPCVISPTQSIRESLLATGFPYDRRTSPDNNFAAFVAMKKATIGVRRCGSAALDLCLVADGTYDGYWESKLHAWDITAGIAIVLAAGGKVTSVQGGPVDVVSGNVLASNGIIHEELVHHLKDIGAAVA